MNSKTLITFGCSWTFGVGVGYQEPMSALGLKEIAHKPDVCNKKSFRGLLSERYQFDNLNFSEGGSSNQKQFRRAKHFFNSKQFDQLKNTQNEIVVLWGITSTARNEVFSILDNKLLDVFLKDDEGLIQKFLLKYTYDHDHEVFSLAEEMLHWNRFFESHNIKNYWFDTFNHHDYSVNDPSVGNFKKPYNTVAGPDWPDWQSFLDKRFNFDSEIGQEILDTSRFYFSQFIRTAPVENFVINHPTHRDLMSQLAINYGLVEPDSDYHLSDWTIDSKRVEFLVSQKLLNPHSHHPTELGHQQIANMFDHIFDK
jgi:hypothetical protein